MSEEELASLLVMQMTMLHTMVELILKEYKKRRDDSRKLVDEFYTPDEDDQTQDESETD